MGRKKAVYDDAVQERIRNEWIAHKEKTGISQAKAAEFVGMNQSAFSQYLRGAVSLNTEFISKFARLVGKEPSHFDERLSTHAFRNDVVLENSILPVRYSATGVKYDPPKYVTVLGYYVGDDRVAIEIDADYFQYRRGYIIVAVESKSTVKDTQEVVIFDKDDNLKGFGELEELNGSWLVRTVIAGVITRIPCEKSDKIRKIIGVYCADPVNKRSYPY